jgi:hypothetical protein
MPNSIIVYRNPIEAAFWESGMLIPIMVGCVAWFAVFLASNQLAELLWKQLRKNSRNWQMPVAITYGCMALACIPAFYTFKFFSL